MNTTNTQSAQAMLPNPSRTVYAYYFTEVRDIIDRLTAQYPHETYLQAVNGGLDDFHVSVLDALQAYAGHEVAGLDVFANRYVAGGASEAIFHILADIAANRADMPLYVLDAEYEGYAGYGKNLGLTFTTVAQTEDFAALPAGMFFISNPSARDGNVLPEGLVEQIGEAGHTIVLDVTYLGLTQPLSFDVNKPYIESVLFSISKPFGVYYHRIGYAFSRRDYNTLFVNQWFKNLFSQILAKELFTTYRPGCFTQKYTLWQEKAVAELRQRYGVPIVASDVFLLAYVPAADVPADKQAAIAEFKRGDNYRFCLTPLYLEYEKAAAVQ